MRVSFLTSALLFALLLSLVPQLSAKEWITYENCSLVDDRYFDGDSFSVRAPTGYTYIFRLYGVDCGETDARYPDRLAAQGKEFGIEPDEVVKWGKAAQDFVRKFLEKDFTVHTQKAKAGGQSKKNRYYAIVINADGERLDEALVSAGLARAFGVGAEWPERMKPERFIRKLHALESRAKREDEGVWKDSSK